MIGKEAMVERNDPQIHEKSKCDITTELEAPLWSFDCLVVCTCLGLGLTKKEIKKLCHKYELIPKDQTVDPGYGFFRLHHASHKKSHLTKNLTKMFNQRYRLTIEQVRRMPTENIQEWNNLLKEALEEDHPMPVLWALLTDPRPDINHYGVYLAHYAAMDSLQSVGKRQGKESDPALSKLTTDYRNLKKRLAQASREKIRLTKELAESRLANENLATQVNLHTSRITELKGRPSREAKLERELRKVRYKLENMKTSNGEAASETGKSVDQEPKELRFICNDSAACPGISCLSQPRPKDCPLEGLKVGIIGGLDRMESKYARIVQNLGATFLSHSGRCKNGTYTLRNMVCNADIVVFITSCNSHPALRAVKATCRRTGKSFYVLKQTGAESLKKMLLQAAS